MVPCLVNLKFDPGSDVSFDSFVVQAGAQRHGPFHQVVLLNCVIDLLVPRF